MAEEEKKIGKGKRRTKEKHFYLKFIILPLESLVTKIITFNFVRAFHTVHFSPEAYVSKSKETNMFNY